MSTILSAITIMGLTAIGFIILVTGQAVIHAIFGAGDEVFTDHKPEPIVPTTKKQVDEFCKNKGLNWEFTPTNDLGSTLSYNKDGALVCQSVARLTATNGFGYFMQLDSNHKLFSAMAKHAPFGYPFFKSKKATKRSSAKKK